MESSSGQSEPQASAAPGLHYGYLRFRAPKRRDTTLAHVTDLAKSFRILSPQTHLRSLNDAICAHKRRPRRTCRGPHFLQPPRATPNRKRTTMLTLDQPQLHTPNGVAPPPPRSVARTPSTRAASPPTHPSIPSPRAADPPTPPAPSPHTHDALPHQTRMEITNALLDPESDPRDIALSHNLPLDTILDIFESEDFQHRLQRIERMQQRRAEFHLSATKPLAARNLALILEASLAEELTRTSRDTPQAATLRCRARETTRKVCNNILSPKSTTPRATDMSSCRCPGTTHDDTDVPKNTQPRSTDMSPRHPPPSESREAAKACSQGRKPLEGECHTSKPQRGESNPGPSHQPPPTTTQCPPLRANAPPTSRAPNPTAAPRSRPRVRSATKRLVQ